MPNQHEHPARTFRPDPVAEWAPAKVAVNAAGLDMNRVLRAVMRWIATDPDRALRTLGPHVPPSPPRGRPRSAPLGVTESRPGGSGRRKAAKRSAAK